MQEQFAALRSEVDSVMETLRTEVEDLREQLAGDQSENWAATSARMEEGRGDVQMQLARLDMASVEEAQDIRDDIATELAEMEAEVVRQDLRLASGPQAVAEAIEARLAELDEALDTIQSRTVASTNMVPVPPPLTDPTTGLDIDPATGERVPTDTVAGPAMTPGAAATRVADGEPDAEDVRELREQIRETRADVAALATTADAGEREESREELTDRVAQLTRDVRRHWYAVRYSFDANAGGGVDSPTGP